MQGFLSDFRAGIFVALLLLPSFVFVPHISSIGGRDLGEVYTASLLVALAGTALLGFFRIGILLAPSPRIALPIVYLLVISHGLAWHELFLAAFVAVLIGGLLIFLGTHFRSFGNPLPDGLRRAIFPATSLSLIFYGLEQVRILQPSPQGLLQLGGLFDPVTYFALIGLVAAAGVWQMGWKYYAIPAGMALVALLSLIEGFWVFPDAPFFLPASLNVAVLTAENWDFSGHEALFFHSILWIFLLVWAESICVLQSLSEHFTRNAFAKELKEKNAAEKVPLSICGQLGAILLAVNFFAVLLGTLPFAYVPENLASSQLRGRGFAIGAGMVFLALLFLLPTARACLEFSAIFAVPLIAVGVLCLLSTQPVFAGDPAERVSAGIFLLLFPLTQDILFGGGAAFFAHIFLRVMRGRGREIPLMQWILAFVLIFVLIDF